MEIWPSDSFIYWRLVTDAVMGGVSFGTIAYESLDDRKALRMRGNVSTENNGGFIQMTLDFDPKTESFDATSFKGVEIDVRGNQKQYGAHLRTVELSRPQQSYRQKFKVTPMWQTIRLPFDQFHLHRTDIPMNTAKLNRIGLVAIGQDFIADLAVARVAFY